MYETVKAPFQPFCQSEHIKRIDGNGITHILTAAFGTASAVMAVGLHHIIQSIQSSIRYVLKIRISLHIFTIEGEDDCVKTVSDEAVEEVAAK